MTTLAFDLKTDVATNVVVTDDSLIVDLADGRERSQSPVHGIGIPGSCMPVTKRRTVGASSAGERAFIGRILTRISVWKIS